jgi:solute:Na+ symporter, SSS family
LGCIGYIIWRCDFRIFNLAAGTIEEVRWAIATLIEIIFCFAVFIISGNFKSKDNEYNQRVAAFFQKLKVPYVPAKETTDDSAFADAIKLMYGIAFALTGSMFIIMGFPSKQLLSGQLALGSGFLCLVIGAALYFKRKKKIITNE